MNEKRLEELETLKAMIVKQHGKGAVTQLSDIPPFNEDRIIRSGSIALDIALGIGGYPKGRIVEIYGDTSTGKSTLTLHAIANAQTKGMTCALVDIEQATDLLYSKQLGVDVDALLFSQPSYGEQALDIVEMMCRSGLVGLIVIDSVAALTPKAEIEGEMGDQAIGLQARLMSKAMRKLVAVANLNNTVIILTNQIRHKIGGYGNPIVTSSGNALRFYASQRLETWRKEKIEEKIDGEKVITGNRVKVKVVKNKVAPPFKEAEFDIIYGIGIDKVSEVLDFAVMDNLIIKSGAFYKLNDEAQTKIAHGRVAAVEYLRENVDLMKEFRNKILEKRGLK